MVWILVEEKFQSPEYGNSLSETIPVANKKTVIFTIILFFFVFCLRSWKRCSAPMMESRCWRSAKAGHPASSCKPPSASARRPPQHRLAVLQPCVCRCTAEVPGDVSDAERQTWSSPLAPLFVLTAATRDVNDYCSLKALLKVMVWWIYAQSRLLLGAETGRRSGTCLKKLTFFFSYVAWHYLTA